MAQLILERHSTPDIQEVPELPSTERGSQGFGSTGRNELTVAADQPVINQIETNSHKHKPILQFIGVLLSLLSQCSAAGDSRCSQSQTSAVGDSLHPQGISVSRIDAVGDSLRGEVSPRLDTVGDSLCGDAPLGCDTVGDLPCGDSTPRTDSAGDSSNRDTALLLSAVGDPLASGSGDLAGALLLTIGALMCRRSRQPLYSTVHSIPFSCTQASNRIAEVALRDLSQTGGPNSAGHSPESAWAPDYFMAGWGYPRCTDYRAGKVPNIVPDVAHRYEDGLTSLNLLSQEQDVTSVFARLVHRQERNTRRVSINPNITQKFSAWMTRPGMPITVEAYACNQVAHFPRTWGVKTPPLSQPWHSETLWLHPPNGQWPQVAQKMVGEASRGIAVMPVVKSATWWWLVGEVAVDWVEIPKGHPLFVDAAGRPVCCRVPYRVVYFDSVGHPQVQPAPSPQPQVGHSAPSALPSKFSDADYSDIGSDPESEFCAGPDGQFVLSDSGLPRHQRRQRRRRVRKVNDRSQQYYWIDYSGLEGESDQGISDEDPSDCEFAGTDSALLQVVHEEPLSFTPTPERGIQFTGNGLSSQGIFSVVQADVEFPECEDLRKVLVEEFQQSVFTRKKFEEVDNSKRGPEDIAFVHLDLVGDPKPHSAKAIRTVGVREQVLYDMVQGFLKQGFIRECTGRTDWVSRAFLVPKPNGKWRLVIDYRYLNTQLRGVNFPLPVIEDQLARQVGNSVFSLVDLEGGFHQMHLTESSCHLTAFITPFGVYEWRVLPMGVKVGPQVFQRLVAWVVRNCPFSCPYIDDVLTGTGDSVRYVDSDRGKGKLFDSHAYADRPAEEFLHPCFKPPPVLPDGSVNTDLDTPFSYDLPQSPTLREQLYFHYLCLRELFNAFASADLTVKPAKCFLLRQQVQYVGHVLAGGKRFPNPDKTKALREWETTHITTAKA